VGDTQAAEVAASDALAPKDKKLINLYKFLDDLRKK
jgi:hypothetical protein